jgi:small-conductance mechanosensitive channel
MPDKRVMIEGKQDLTPLSGLSFALYVFFGCIGYIFGGAQLAVITLGVLSGLRLLLFILSRGRH